MPESKETPIVPLLAPFQMLSMGIQNFFASQQAMLQGALNVGATNIQEFSKTVQQGQAQFVTGMNQGMAGITGVLQKPMVDIGNLGAGGKPAVSPQWMVATHPWIGQGVAPQQQQAPQHPATIFSPIEQQTADTLPPKGEQYHPLTEAQSNFREGGFTASPRATDEPAQSKKRVTLFL